MPLGAPKDVEAITDSIRNFLNTRHENGKRIGSAKGVYVFFDYDEEPIYVGQTDESLGTRIRRHLTNKRTDPVAMGVLDPFEVAYIEVWPLKFGEFTGDEKRELHRQLMATEYTVHRKVIQASKLKAILNEKDIPKTDEIELPQSYRAKIVPDSIFDARLHPDIRIARRASTIARLAQVISERNPSAGLRRTLVTQSTRLYLLASERFAPFSNDVPQEKLGENTGEDSG